ncbi:GNAT family N-acetyltransferase [Terracoccus luteus]|uniref:Putative GNAT superfamily acetyltransferase n=1 Tax=Terracoccus luteus TaxID=53356 RepID=A0A839PXH1_9MICO|nr:GNAT family N-acetyltransferase [Terracoccus luteus]MBB2986686.1 putative GNAT superfamily acetyltransferase [Terracoccus luteus]MCP2172337.1 putative GNAT superfamily acetyltransferase [Terracoccus luteus]
MSTTTVSLGDGAAERAARAAGVEVRPVDDLDELREMVALFSTIWGTPPLTTELLRAFSKAGDFVGGAFDEGRLVGGCVGFFGPPAHHAMHSHIAGVAASARRRHVGFALKALQREWALARDVTTVEWTFDPLVARNAHVNVVKLAADPVQYLPDFYGPMGDAINGGDATDRLLVRWDLLSPDAERACAGIPRRVDLARLVADGAGVALGVGSRGEPVAADGPTDSPVTLVAVPRDVEALRATEPALAREWRAAVRQALGRLLDDGGRVVGFDASVGYVVRR